jgi:hypothetical protein
VLEIVDLWRDGGEAFELGKQLVLGPYPEAAEDIEAVQRAIVYVCWGYWRLPLDIAGREAAAGEHVLTLGLKRFVDRRLNTRAN